MQATFTLTLEHPQNETVALSNSEVQVRLLINHKMETKNNDNKWYFSLSQFQNDSMTTFKETIVFSTYSFAWAVLPSNEFNLVTQNFSNTQVNNLFKSNFQIESK